MSNRTSLAPCMCCQDGANFPDLDKLHASVAQVTFAPRV